MVGVTNSFNMGPRVIPPSSDLTSACHSSSSIDIPDSLPEVTTIPSLTPSPSPSLPTNAREISTTPRTSQSPPRQSLKRPHEHDHKEEEQREHNKICESKHISQKPICEKLTIRASATTLKCNPFLVNECPMRLKRPRKGEPPPTMSWSSSSISTSSVHHDNHDLINIQRRIELPDEVLVVVFGFVRRAASLAQLRGVCKQWCRVIDTTPAVWRLVSFRNAIFGRRVETHGNKLILGKRAGKRAVTLAARAGNEWACFLHSVLYQRRGLCAVTTPQPVASMLVCGQRAVHERAFPPWRDREQPQRGGTWVAIHAARRSNIESEEIDNQISSELNENVMNSNVNISHNDAMQIGSNNESYGDVQNNMTGLTTNGNLNGNHITNEITSFPNGDVTMNENNTFFNGNTIDTDANGMNESEVSAGGVGNVNSNMNINENTTQATTNQVVEANSTPHGAMVGVIHVKEAFKMAGSGVGLSAAHWVWRIDRAVSLKKPIRCAGYVGLWPVSTFMTDLLVNSLHRQ